MCVWVCVSTIYLRGACSYSITPSPRWRLAPVLLLRSQRDPVRVLLPHSRATRRPRPWGRHLEMRFPAATVRSLAHRSRFAAAAAAVASFGTVIGGVTMLESARTPLPLARVVSYNVLSSHLCGADHYIKCKPEDLDPPTRRKRVEALLSEHMDKQAVICLQEVRAMLSALRA